MKDYSDIGLDPRLKKANAIGSKEREWQSEYSQDAHVEKGPYANPTMISQGTISTTLGGIVDFKDEGGTTVFTYNPATRVISITGNLSISGTANFGTAVTTGTINASYGTITSARFGTINEITRGSATWINVSGTAVINEILMASNNDNKIREFYGLGLALGDNVGVNAVRIQNFNLSDLVQFSSKGGITLVPQSSIGTPDEGQLYYDSDDNKLKFWNGSAWETITSSA